MHDAMPNDKLVVPAYRRTTKMLCNALTLFGLAMPDRNNNTWTLPETNNDPNRTALILKKNNEGDTAEANERGTRADPHLRHLSCLLQHCDPRSPVTRHGGAGCKRWLDCTSTGLCIMGCHAKLRKLRVMYIPGHVLLCFLKNKRIS